MAKKKTPEIVPDQKTDFDGWLCWKLGVSREKLQAMRDAVPDHTAAAVGIRAPKPRAPDPLVLQPKNEKELQRLKVTNDREEIRRANARKAAENRERWLNELKQK